MASHKCCKVILLSIALIYKISGFESSQCSDYGKMCDPYSPQPCCNPKFGCMISRLEMKFFCMEIGQLFSPCHKNDDCSWINNLECSKENICVCKRAGYVEFNQICRPSLGERCVDDHSCFPRNSVCNDNKCKCDFNYFQHTKNYCLPVILGTPCSDDTVCQQVRFAKCSDEKICKCKSNAGVINPAKCASLLNGYCLTDDDCYHVNSSCVDNTCQCKPKHVSSKLSTVSCLPGYLNMTCQEHLPCEYFIENTICSFEGQCVCRSRYVPINESSCGLKFAADCFSNEICATVNSACIYNKCQCRPNYVYRNDKCLPKFLNESCKFNNDCVEIKHSICSKQKCVYEDNNSQINKTTCGKRTAGNFRLEQSCSGNGECRGISYAHCIDNKCQCKPQYAKLNDTACAPILGAFCWKHGPCSGVNVVCIDYLCQCRAGFLAQFHNKCIKNYLGSSCERFDDCEMLHSKCSNNKCVCLSGYVPLNRTICAPLLGAFCWRSEKCAPDNAVCVGNECRCREGFSQKSNNHCLPTSLGQFCRVNSDCNAIKYSICFENTCVCQSNTVPVGGNICKSLLDGICDNKEDCFPRNGACIDHTCKCGYNVLPQSNFKCPVGFVNTTYARMGIDDELKCSVDGICICNPNHAALNDSICAPGLGEDCNYLCLTDNAACINNKCQCKPNYRPRVGKFCKPKLLHLACAFDFDCDDVENAECSNGECVCRNKYAEVDVKTCRPLLEGFCLSDSDCLTDHASCIDNQCQCSKYFAAANDSCLLIEKFCNVNADCADIDNAECSDNVCKCKQNYRKLTSIMCEPLVGGTCRSDAQCRIPNSACRINTCQCIKYYVANSNNQCVLLTLGQPCIDNLDCRLIPHAVCSNNICSCKENFIAFDEETCLPIIGGYCLKDMQCRYNTTECIDGKCQCKESFTAVSSHQCRPKFSISSCSDVTECGDHWHYQCSDGKCICAENNIFVDSWTCSPIIGGACWADRQCVVQNSDCIDFKCQCKPNFVAIANNKCLKKTL